SVEGESGLARTWPATQPSRCNPPAKSMSPRIRALFPIRISTAAGGFNSRPNMETSRFCRPTSGRIHPPWERLHDLARRLLARCGSGARAAARSRLGFDRQTLRAKVRWEGDFLIERLEISE